MPIDFHNENVRFTYAGRAVDCSWLGEFQEWVDVRDRRIADIGCGGGIYSKAMIELGAAHVTGVDYSEMSLESARQYCEAVGHAEFVKGDAATTSLPSGQYDVVLERALIHHLPELSPCFNEAYRLLDVGGTLIVQDRTPEDCLLAGSSNHIRGYLFEKFPSLAQVEADRRHASHSVIEALKAAGFRRVDEFQFWETRRVYAHFDLLADDLLKRTGRSILHEISDEELKELVEYIRKQLGVQAAPIVEQDRWTVWKASK
ncbi:class I SAM-dependent methyltransferase [Paenibacillus kobensis]|uniref:class I SAM-dependent methyltransferase n=1 Tax=Paenibacillus kobensis TaxID=59841 RepID=UPI000FDAB5DA|nr:class I SAM-dependent methyltransferase [Paenibacillus kobensis]